MPPITLVPCGPTYTAIGAWAAPGQTRTTVSVILVTHPVQRRRGYRGKTLSEQWRHEALVAFSARHSSRTKQRSRILSYSFDLQSCLHKYKRLACRVCGNALEKEIFHNLKN